MSYQQAKETVSFQEPCRPVFRGAPGPHVVLHDLRLGKDCPLMSLLVPSLQDSHGASEEFSGEPPPPTSMLPSLGHAADVARKPGVLSHCPPRDCLRPAGGSQGRMCSSPGWGLEKLFPGGRNTPVRSCGLAGG